MQKSFWLALLLLVLSSIVPAQLFAETNAPLRANPVVLNGVAQAHKLSEDLTNSVDTSHGQSIESVDIIHVGDDYPTELTAMLVWYRAHNVKVNFKRVSLKEFEELLDKQESASREDLWSTVKFIRYETHANDDADEETARKTFFDHARELKARILHTFGIPNGISFVAFNLKRTASEKLVEGAVTGIKVVMGAVVGYHSMVSKIADGQHLNIPLALVTAAAFTIGFDYFGRQHSAFKGQGWAYDYEKGDFVMNRKTHMLVSFIHTFVMRPCILIAAHITGFGFTAGFDDFVNTFETSALGQVGKAPFDMWIERARRTHSKWWTIGVMTAWGLSYSALTTAAQFQVHHVFGYQVGHLFRYVMFGVGTVGLFADIFIRNANATQLVWKRFQNWIRGIDTRATCQTLLLNRVSITKPESKSD